VRAPLAFAVAGIALLAAQAAIAQPDPTQQPDITDQIAPSQSEARVTLFEEDPDDRMGKRWPGSIVWRIAEETQRTDQPPETVVKGDITVPDRGMSIALTLHRETDSGIPASHTVDIVFRLTADSPASSIMDLAGILMKQGEVVRGVPLEGLAVKVIDNYFLVGLSSEPADRDRNMHLLKEWGWFDIPFVYGNGRRAILAMEKGTPGERAFQQAFAVWEKP
jgi:hypothetical protein